MRHPFFTICLFFTFHSSLCQVAVNGKVLDQKSKRPIPFVNIGILKANIGTLSNEDGSFRLQISEKWLNDSLTFSSLGYERKSIAIRLITPSVQAVYLEEKASLLNTVTVTDKRMKPQTFQLGNTSMKGGVLQEDTTYAGRSIALLIDNEAPKAEQEFPLYLEKARLRIMRNNLRLLRFRVRINEVDEKTGWPGKDLLEQSMIATSIMRSGWLEFDLSPLNMVVSKSFFVTFEQLTTKDDRIAIADGYRKFIKEHPERVQNDTMIFEGRKVPVQMLKRGGIDLPGTFIAISHDAGKFTCYTRPVSLGNWEKVRGIVTATVTFSTHKK